MATLRVLNGMQEPYLPFAAHRGAPAERLCAAILPCLWAEQKTLESSTAAAVNDKCGPKPVNCGKFARR